MSVESDQDLLNEVLTESCSQWVTSILNVESKSRDNLNYLNTILGPLENFNLYNRYNRGNNDAEAESTTATSNRGSGAGFFTHEIIFKINEKVFIESLNIYEKVVADSSILKIEALQGNENWFLMWDTAEPLLSLSKAKIFTPNITPPAFKTDTIKLIISGSLHLIDAIEVKGNKVPIENSNKEMVPSLENESDQSNAFKDYSLYSRHLYSLIKNDLFADVFFEVEAQIVPAHRNILVYRSEYFKAMIGSNGSFKESFELANKNESSAQIKPIYIKDIVYDVFIQVINYLYSGHIYDHKNIPIHILLGIMQAADLMNLCNLEKLCLFHLSELITPKNVVKIYKEAYESPDVLKQVISMCNDVITTNFALISRCADFCSLPQEPMLKIIENVVPRLARLNSEIINNQNNQANVQNNSPTDDLNEEAYREEDDHADESSSSDD